MPAVFKSCAVATIICADFTSKPDSPIASGPMLAERLDQFLGRHLDAEIDDAVAVVAENDLDQVLADVVDVALDGREHNLAAWLALSDFSMCGSRCATAAFIASADCSTSATIIWLALNSRPTSSMPFINGPLMISSGRARVERLVEILDEAVLRAFEDVAREALVERQRLALLGGDGLLLRARKYAAKAAIGSSPRHQIRSSASWRSSSGIEG